MKKAILVIIAVMVTASFCSCFHSDTKETDISNLLKISTWVLDKDLEGTGYWSYDEILSNKGCWIFYDSDKRLDDEAVFKFEQLELHETRIMAPLGYLKNPNLNILFDFDGIIEITAEKADNDEIRLAHSLEEHSNPQLSNWIVENNIKVVAPVTVNICPIGDFTLYEQVVAKDTITDREYYLNVKTSKLDGTPVISAKLKLTVLDDEGYPPDKYGYYLVPGNYEARSRFLSVELIEYEYSDIYKFN